MEFEIDFDNFHKKVKHLYPNKEFGILLLRTSDYQEITSSLFGIKYTTSSYDHESKSATLKFNIINKEKFIWAKLKYAL